MTAAEDRERLIELGVRVEVLENRQDKFDRSCGDCRHSLNGAVSGINDRLRALELRLAAYTGAAAVLGSLGGALIAHIVGG